MGQDLNLMMDLKKVVDEMAKNVDPYENMQITAENIFQPAKKNNRVIFKKHLDTLIKEGSGVIGKENLIEFYENFKKGKSSLILSEHKSNFDVPVFYAVMYNQEPLLQEIFESIAFIAGRKLNEEAIFVKLMAEQFNRVIVVPKSETKDASEEEISEAIKINMTTQNFIKHHRNQYIFLVFPTGTRAKSWDRETYKGIREVVNYIKSFDQAIFMSINGNCMVPLQTNMSSEPPRKDRIEIIFSKPFETKNFLQSLRKDFDQQKEEGDFKQFTINRVMDSIYGQKGIMPWDEK